jgi:hypothetical protein
LFSVGVHGPCLMLGKILWRGLLHFFMVLHDYGKERASQGFVFFFRLISCRFQPVARYRDSSTQDFPWPSKKIFVLLSDLLGGLPSVVQHSHGGRRPAARLLALIHLFSLCHWIYKRRSCCFILLVLAGVSV